MGLGVGILAGVLGAASIATGVIGANAAKDAAKLQSQAATTASDNTLEQYKQTRADLSPFVDAGKGGIGTLNGLLPGSPNRDPLALSLESLTPGSKNPDGSLAAVNQLLGLTPSGAMGPGGKLDSTGIQKTLESTPGYQFTRDQGLKATQNGFAAQGLGSSGAALKGAASFATGLADATYEQRLQDYLGSYGTKFTNTYNAVGQRANIAQNLVTTGENAGAQSGNLGITANQTAGNFLTSGAAAGAGGIVGGANALTSGINGVGSAGLFAALKTPGFFSGSNALNPGGSPAASDLVGVS